jgi:hydrogenase nickel incorporation protein HypA/HybF
MHELSIALSIVEIASEEAAKHGDARIEAVHLKLGALSGVVKDALLFAWELACQETPLAGSTLQVEEIPVRVWCPSCQAERALNDSFDFRCTACGGLATEVRSGRELQVTALELR